MKNCTARRLFPLVLLCLLLAACSKPPQPPLRIASSPWPGYEPLYLARDLGYLDEKEVDLFELPSSDINIESFRNHSTDIATLTLDETLGLLQGGTRLKILAVMDVSHGGDAVLANPSVKTLKDIQGKRIAIVNIPLGLYMLSRTLDLAGVSRGEVSVYPMSESNQVNFYRQGKAEVVITFEPIKTRLKELGAHVIFDSSLIPDEIFDLLVIHEDVYLQRRVEACRLVQNWYRALDYLRDHPDDAALRISKRMGVKPADIPVMMEGIVLPGPDDNKRILGGDQPGIIEPAGRLSEILMREKILPGLVDVRPALDPEFTGCY